MFYIVNILRRMFMKKALLVSVILSLTLSVWAQDGTMMKADNLSPADGSMMKAEPMDASAYSLKGLGSQVVGFTSEMAAQNLAMKSTVVYYFAATWCPDCQVTYKDLKANFAKLPPNLTLVVVNYDKSSDLKKKYGVTMQHTFVVIGTKGEKKKVWNGPTMVSDLIKNAASM